MNIYYKTNRKNTTILACCSICGLPLVHYKIDAISTDEIEGRVNQRLLDEDMKYCPKCATEIRMSNTYRLSETD